MASRLPCCICPWPDQLGHTTDCTGDLQTNWYQSDFLLSGSQTGGRKPPGLERKTGKNHKKPVSTIMTHNELQERGLLPTMLDVRHHINRQCAVRFYVVSPLMILYASQRFQWIAFWWCKYHLRIPKLKQNTDSIPHYNILILLSKYSVARISHLPRNLWPSR